MPKWFLLAPIKIHKDDANKSSASNDKPIKRNHYIGSSLSVSNSLGENKQQSNCKETLSCTVHSGYEHYSSAISSHKINDQHDNVNTIKSAKISHHERTQKELDVVAVI